MVFINSTMNANGKNLQNKSVEQLYKQVWALSLFTIFYNILEGLASTIIGFDDETLALFGFGVDSFIEVISGIGIAVMVYRMKKNSYTSKTKFEINALRITGTSFYLLSAGLAIGVVLNIIQHHQPETTLWGVVISLISILVMYWLVVAKKKVGKQLQSDAIVADANCTKVCIYMSVVLLAASLIYEFTGFAYADSVGTIGLIYFSIGEGKEAFEKAKGKSCDCCECH